MLGKTARSSGETQADPPDVVLSIAGFDPSSGAGVSADVQTFAAHGLFGMAVITALTVQSTLGVVEVQPVEAGLVRRSLEHLIADVEMAGLKVGMLGSVEVLRAVADFLREARAAGQAKVVVLDPVLRSSSGHGLFPGAAVEALRAELLPLVDWVTPNWSELAVLSGFEVRDEESAQRAVKALGERHPHLAIVATGGDWERPLDLLRLPGGVLQVFEGTFVETSSTHGTGCAFSSALLARLVRGAPPIDAVREAKHFVEGALRHAPGVGQGRGPMDLLWPLRT